MKALIVQSTSPLNAFFTLLSPPPYSHFTRRFNAHAHARFWINLRTNPHSATVCLRYPIDSLPTRRKSRPKLLRRLLHCVCWRKPRSEKASVQTKCSLLSHDLTRSNFQSYFFPLPLLDVECICRDSHADSPVGAQQSRPVTQTSSTHYRPMSRWDARGGWRASG